MTRKENLENYAQGLDIDYHLKSRMLQFIVESDYNHLTGFVSCLFLTGLINQEEHGRYFNILTKAS